MKIKKTLALLLGVTLLVTSFAGCGKKQETLESSADGKSFTYWTSMPTAIVSKYESMADMLMYSEMEKKTGVKIEFVHPPVGQEVEQFNLVVASRQFPDFIEWDWENYTGGPEKAIKDKVIIPINDYLEESAPNLSKIFNENETYAKLSKTDSGAYYGFPAIHDQKYTNFSGILIRQDWLDELNLPMPETLEDWENTLRAFKEKKGAKAPFTGDSYTMFNMFSTKETFNSAFNVGKGLYIENDEVKFGPLEEGYKEWITMLRRWYKEGLLDADYATNTTEVIDAKMTNGTSGALFGYIGGTIGKYMNAMKEKDPKYNLVGAPLPKNSKDSPLYAMNISYPITNPFIAISTSCKNPEAAAAWADNWYSEEGRLIKNFGVEGDTYNMVDGKPVYTDKIIKNPEGLDVGTAMSMNFRANAGGPGFNNLEDYLLQYYQLPQQVNALKTFSRNPDDYTISALPLLTPTDEEFEKISIVRAEAGTYIDETIQKFVQGTKSMDEWDDFIKNLKKLDIEEYIKIYQNAYDRWKNR